MWTKELIYDIKLNRKKGSTCYIYVNKVGFSPAKIKYYCFMYIKFLNPHLINKLINKNNE